jgi:8-oxo-dGTP pyrophosphatase MutT (NUDIX family)
VARPSILNPSVVPVIGNDSHLPPVDPDRLTQASLRARFAHMPAAWSPEFRGDGASFAERSPAEASVLVGLVPRGDGKLHVLLTQRTPHLANHAGQVSFPGGRREPDEASAAATALREAHEEIGLEPARVDVLGQLPTYTTVTNFVITPVVGIVTPPPAYVPDPNEVDEVFEIPLEFLMNPANHQRHRFEWEGQSRVFLSMTWREAHAGSERFVWGATAAMLRNVYRLLIA